MKHSQSTRGQLGDLVDHKKGFAFKSKSYVPYGHPIVRVSNLTDRSIDMTGCNFLADTDVDQYRDVELHEGDIVIATVGSGPSSPASLVGRAIRVPSEAKGALLNQNAVRLRASSPEIDQRYLFYCLRQPEFQQYLVGGAQGSANQASITLKLIFDYGVPMFDVTEQKAIAKILGTLDDKIELNRRMNETLESIARAIFKSWFVDFDPVRAKLEGNAHEQQSSASAYPMPAEVYDLFPSAFQDSELGKIPEGWEVCTLSSIAPLQTITVKPQEHEDVLWQHFSIPAFDVDKNPVWELGSEIKSNKYAVPDTCVLLSKLNPHTPRIWMPSVDNTETAICSTEFMPFVPESKHHLPFIYEQICSDSLQADILSRATGSTGSRQRVKPKEIAEILVINPSNELVDSFCDITGAMMSLAQNNQIENVKLAQLRDTLLPKLLSGELTVPEALLQAEEVL